MPKDFSTKLTGGFLVVIMLLGGTALLTVRQLARTSTGREADTREYVEDVILAERLRGEEKQTAVVGRGFLITGDPKFLQELSAAEVQLDGVLKHLEERVDSREGEALMRQIRTAVGEYEGAVRGAIVARQHDAGAEVVRRFERDVMPRRQQLERAVDAFVAHKGQLREAAYTQARAEALQASVIGIVAIAAAVALSSSLAWILCRQLVRAYRREHNAVRVAERAVAAREELLGIVAHDLRSPLGAISMQAALLRTRSIEEKTRRSGESIENIARRMEYVVRSLLDAASIEAGKFSVNAAPFAVGELLREAVDTLAAVAATRSIHLELRPLETRLGVLADRDRVLQVLTNLVGNAVKFSPKGGTVRITAERVGEMVRFSVADSGPGVEPEHVPHLFERFWSAEKRGETGSGLGLYISKGIVEAHGGNIWVESNPGMGAIFYFTLAFASPPDIAESPPVADNNEFFVDRGPAP